MIVGFTGTRNGMTDNQLEALRLLLSTSGVEEVHHGDCVGSDAQFHRIATELGISVVIHPPTNSKLRAFCESTRYEPPKEYLARNRDIVSASDLLVAAPKEADEPEPGRGQGTWSTVRYARRFDRTLRVLWP